MVRLDKFLSDAGIGTRSEVKKHIRNRKISVNEILAVKPEQKIDPDKDRVCFEGKRILWKRYSYYLFHKPAGCVTAKCDRKDPTIMEYFPETLREKLCPVGRLDKDTEGLLLLTNDGELNHRLTSPSYHLPKTYYARSDSPIPENAVELFAKGIDIGDDKPALPASLHIFPPEYREGKTNYGAELTITEGRFHQVKRMFLAVGCHVIYLKRLSMGCLSLGTLGKGRYRPLTEQELSALRAECDRKGLSDEI